MAESGEVLRGDVIHVLRAHRVGVSIQVDGLPDMYVLAKSGIVEAHRMPDRVGRRKLQHFHRKFGIPIHHFYNPLMAPPLPGEPIQ